ncbi:MAG: hypothetical protein KDA91_18435 [Planctomycetaceae bacterium]|nr:hypothetical protein [Planctomycetaceae bacterium]
MFRISQAVFFLVLFLTPRVDADIIYQVVPYSGFAPGYGLESGFITTDGTIGQVDASHIVAFEFRFHTPSNNYVVDSTNHALVYFDNSDAELVATPTSLDFHAATSGSLGDDLVFGDIFQSITFGSSSQSTHGFVELFGDFDISTSHPAGPGQILNIANAAVPEPSFAVALAAILVILRRGLDRTATELS